MNKAPVVFRAILLLGILIGVVGVNSTYAQYTRGTAAADELPATAAVLDEPVSDGNSAPAIESSSPALTVSDPSPAVPTIITNKIEFSPVMDFESFPVNDLANQLKDINKDENEALRRATEEKFEALTSRLNAIETSIGTSLDLQRTSQETQSARDADLMGEMQKFTTTFVAVIAVVCVLGMALVGYMLWRSNNQLAEVATGLSQFPKALQQSSVAGHLESPREAQALPAPADESSEKLKSALAQLENRIQELEQTSDERDPDLSQPNESVEKNGDHKEIASEGLFEVPTEREVILEESNNPNTHDVETVGTLLEQGESQINKGAFNKALNTLRRADEMSPENPEILVKIGSVLEKLRKTEQAIEVYNRAIEKDPSLTIAYLYKGRAFNQMSRFDEALECYERALRTQS